MIKGGVNKMSWYNKTALVIADIGAINWGLAAFGWNLVEKSLGTWPTAVSVVYYIIALCGIYALIKVFQ